MSHDRAQKRIEFFHARAATPVGNDTMVTGEPNEAARTGLARLAGLNVGRGIGDLSVVLFREPGKQGMSLIYLWFKSGYVLPPHSHDGDCLYYVLAGELHMGSHVLRKGDGMRIPAHQVYTYEAGPEGVEVLEFRSATHFEIAMKGTGANWDRVAKVFGERAGLWQDETIPPSERPRK